MKLETRDFGEVEIDEAEMLTFSTPIYGFEEYTRYVLLHDDAMEGAFCWLQSTEKRDICFILADPAAVAPEYRPMLAEDACRQLCLKPGDEPVFRLIAVLPQRIQDATINLKSPVVINPAQKCAAQVILEDDYPVRARLIPDDGGADAC